MNHLPVSASMFSYMLQNSVDVIHIAKLDMKNEALMWKKEKSYLFAG